MAELKNSVELNDDELDEVAGGAGRNIQKPGFRKGKKNISVTDAGGKKPAAYSPATKKTN